MEKYRIYRTGFGEELPVVRRTFFPSKAKKVPVQVSTFECLRVAICEPAEVDNDDEIFGRQRIDIRGASL